VTVPKAGYFTLAVIGNGTKCTYQTAGFSVREQASTAKPTQSATSSKAPRAGTRGGKAPSGATAPLPIGNGGGGNGAGNNLALNPLNGASPFSLPSVAPDGSSQGFQYPSPDPQVAAPPAAQPQARNVSATTPIKWGQSLAVALVLLIISAHLGMWSRRQRLAAEGARSTGGGKLIGRRKKKAASSMVTEATALADGPTATATFDTTPIATDTTAPVVSDPSGAVSGDAGPSGTGRSGVGATGTFLTGTGAAEASSPEADATSGPAAASADDDASAEAYAKHSVGRGYHGRRRRS
jgi:hypothetical protein